MQSENFKTNEAIAGVVPTRNYVAADRAIRKAIRRDGMLAIIGATGLGKSTVRRIVTGRLREKNHTIIEVPPAPTKFREISASIMRTMIEEISGERAQRDIIARSTQLKRILLGNAENKIVLIIDEAQDLQRETMYAIKKIHELGGNGNREFLFTVIFFGKEGLSDLIQPRELGMRIDKHYMQPLNGEEMRQFISLHGLRIDRTGERRLLARTLPTAAAIGQTLRELKSFYPGEKKINSEQVLNFYLRDLPGKISQSRLSYSDLAVEITRRTGRHIDRSTVNKIIHGKMNNPKREEEVIETVNDILADHLSGVNTEKSEVIKSA